ncbi:MAG: UvrD-helicase domain-containing protein [Sulfuriferula sp.]|nr:UvrD-helicase domain-containing protein [Sulfuriferula sp.]
MAADNFNGIALDPDKSVVVEACAGSGKTWLLVARIVRLLLAGVPPAEILAITFTRKAAREMQARLDEWLRFCASASDDEVRQFLRQRAVAEDELDAKLPLARSLFERVLTARPGVTISTFHAWFLEVIQRAPLETGLTGRGLAEQTLALQQSAWASLTQQLIHHPDTPLALAMQDLLAEFGLSSTRKLLQNFIHRRTEWWAYTETQADPLQYALDQLEREIGVSVDADIAAELFADSGLVADLYEYAHLLGLNTATTQQRTADIIAAMNADLSAEQRFEALCLSALSGKGELYVLKPSSTQEKRLGAAAQEAMITLHYQIGERLITTRKQRLAQASYRCNARALALGTALLEHYQAAKNEARVLDFGDVEWQVAQLLSNSEHAEYIQLKLDARYSHILLDEFQDTNPVQWRVLQAWFEAAHQAGQMPKIFLVGDPKQSIYRFRGAEAGLFDLAGSYLQTRGARYLSQNHTRRSAARIVDALNATFTRLADDYTLFQPHQVYDSSRPGRIEVLALAAAEQIEQATHTGYRNPLTEARTDDTDNNAREVEAARLASRITDIVAHWVIDDADGGTRPAQFSDIMILVRNRTHLAKYERALKHAQIPYTSTRRGGLLDSMEIGDLLGLLQFLATPNADLALARILRSPIFSCSDEDLLHIRAAQQLTANKHWWPTLQVLENPGSSLQRAIALLQRWIDLAGQLPVHDLLDRIYFEANLIDRYRAAAPTALQSSVNANLTAFIALTLTLSGGRYPSLPRFLEDIANLHQDSDETPDEGETPDAGNTVTIHTVHGAKGLEAPIVWLLDAGARKPRTDNYRVLLNWEPDAPRPAHFSLITTQDRTAEYQQIYLEQEARHAQREDYNLLYVAMTRARQALIVSGVTSRNGSQNWHRTILTALAQDAEYAISGDDLTQREISINASTAVIATAPALPAAINQPYPIGQYTAAGDTAATAYGTLVHLLLEAIAPPRAVADAALLRTLFGAHAEFEVASRHARDIIGQPHLQRFFDPTQYRRAYNELGYLRQDGSTHRIDRVVEFENEVWVLDYKTDRNENGQQLIQRHRAQLIEYQTAMRVCYPAHTICCAVISANGELVML